MTYASKWEHGSWQPKLPTVEPTTDRLSRMAGIAPIVELFIRDPLFRELRNCLPKRISNSSKDTYHFVLLLLAGFWLGFDCLDDLEFFRSDPLAIEMFGLNPTAKSFGDYLRDFTQDLIEALRLFLTRQAFSYRRRLKKLHFSITFDIDSTDHEHHGDTIEGLQWNHKGKWVLDSLEVFDELGFCYDFQLRPGATFSSQGAPEMIKQILRHRPCDPKNKFDLFRADSAFCNQECISTFLGKNLKGTITAHDNIKWSEQVGNIYNWRDWVYSEEEIKKAALAGITLPKIQVGYYMYRPQWAKKNIAFPVVIKRTFTPYERLSKKKRAKLEAEKKDPRQGVWEHYAVLSLMGLYPKTPQQIVEFHCGRGQMENMIKEEKISFDLRHFPCKPLTANHAYALLGMIAHNFLRLISLMNNPDKPQFAKALRNRFLHIPGRIVYGQNKVKLKIPQPYFKEVMLMRERWAATSSLDPPLSVAENGRR